MSIVVVPAQKKVGTWKFVYGRGNNSDSISGLDLIITPGCQLTGLGIQCSTLNRGFAAYDGKEFSKFFGRHCRKYNANSGLTNTIVP